MLYAMTFQRRLVSNARDGDGIPRVVPLALSRPFIMGDSSAASRQWSAGSLTARGCPRVGVVVD